MMMNIQIPVTPANAINFNFYIFDTRVGGVYAMAIMITRKYVCV